MVTREAAMTKRTNRVAWGLEVGRGAGGVGGGVVRVALYQRPLPEREWNFCLLPIRQWGFMYQQAYWYPAPTEPMYTTDIYSCGFFDVQVTHRPPAGPPTSSHSGTGE